MSNQRNDAGRPEKPKPPEIYVERGRPLKTWEKFALLLLVVYTIGGMALLLTSPRGDGSMGGSCDSPFLNPFDITNPFSPLNPISPLRLFPR